jgi:hypothetical protein
MSVTTRNKALSRAASKRPASTSSVQTSLEVANQLWFVSLDWVASTKVKPSWEGPFTEKQLLARLKSGAFGWAHFACGLTGDGEWTRLCELTPFREYAPQMPRNTLIREIRRAKSIPTKGKPFLHKTIWFLEFEGSEFGPLNEEEVGVVLRSGRLKGRLMGWREGMPDWRLVGDIPELMDLLGGALYGPKDKQVSVDERRKSRRVPLVAAVRFTFIEPGGAIDGPFVGICRDISKAGMLILSNRNPSSAAQVRVEVTPLGPKGFETFLAEARLIRVLPDQWGFSVLFLKIKDNVSLAIDQYMAENV